MNQDKNKQGQQQPDPNRGDPGSEKGAGGQQRRDRERADDREELHRNPHAESEAIPELDEPEVEGVGNEGRTGTDATMPPGQGQNPKRNTM